MTLTSNRAKDSRPPWWFHLLAGPVGWGVYFLIGYGLIEVACTAKLLEARVAGLTVLSVVILALTVLSILLTLFAGWISYRTWAALRAHGSRRTGDPARLRSETVDRPGQAREDSDRFTALSGVLLSGIFSFTILVTGLPALFLHPCGISG